ncbi:MAG: TIGR03986 family CRISPR-associated RAMP protein, partial [Blastocatellia bacterium]|nr:TIGR03986 family CRISPR-associated RAMP protein [Blastocatellia bacterium]
KSKEFIFFLPADHAEEISVPDEMIERFQDDDQITQWQERAFPKDKPDPNCRDRNGMVRKNPPEPGDPVFFLRENEQLTFFGRAQMFRLPYTQRPIDLVPPELRRPEDIDYAEALFGFVRTKKELAEMKQRGVIQEIPKQGDKRRAYAGRVFVTDAVLEDGQSDYWLSPDPITPKILATPKPTAFQHYLVQTGDNKSQLKHYGSPTPQDTIIRGHKRYWHQGLSSDEGLTLDRIRELIEDERARLHQLAETSTQHTQFKPVKPGVKFTFRVYFENLCDRELGALCWTLHPLGDSSKEYCHHLGMGKPLGMGAVKLEATLHLTNRSTRYGTLFDGDNWQTGATASSESLSDRGTLEARVKDFEQHVLETLGHSATGHHLSEVKRIGMLLKLMEWPGFRAVPPIPGQPAPNNCVITENGVQRPNTRYMMIELPGVSGSGRNEYRDRPVLPDPCAFDSSICTLAESASNSSDAPASASAQPSTSSGSTPSLPSSLKVVSNPSGRKAKKRKRKRPNR